jgi:hypothetical protein
MPERIFRTLFSPRLRNIQRRYVCCRNDDVGLFMDGQLNFGTLAEAVNNLAKQKREIKAKFLTLLSLRTAQHQTTATVAFSRLRLPVTKVRMLWRRPAKALSPVSTIHKRVTRTSMLRCIHNVDVASVHDVCAGWVSCWMLPYCVGCDDL